MRITFVSASLQLGGAERVLVLLAKAFLGRSHVVSLVTLNGDEEDFFEVPRGVHRVALGITNQFQALSHFFLFRRSLLSTKPDIVISFIAQVNIMTLLATRMSNLTVVVSERSDPNLCALGSLWARLRTCIYKYADQIVVQTSRAATYFPSEFQSKICIIPNPVLPPNLSGDPLASLPRPLVIAIGRFCSEKGFDLLLKAFSQLKDRDPKWILYILGDGPLRNELQVLCNKLGLEDRARMPGIVKSPNDYLLKADLFVLSSLSEGFPNVLCEAMAAGLPVIATDCPSGPREIIEDGQNGVLVPSQNVEALAEAMERLISDGDERRRLASSARDIVVRFGIDRVVGIWEEMLFCLLDKRKKSEWTRS